MRNLWTRWLRDTDIPLMKEWIERIREKNLFDPAILTYPSLKVMVAEERNGEAKPKMFLPIQTCFVLESLAPEPDTEGMGEAQALKLLLNSVLLKAQENGIGEVYFLCKDESVLRIAEKNGFERVEIPLVRMKL